jgi:hypothetical protein
MRRSSEDVIMSISANVRGVRLVMSLALCLTSVGLFAVVILIAAVTQPSGLGGVPAYPNLENPSFHSFLNQLMISSAIACVTGIWLGFNKVWPSFLLSATAFGTGIFVFWLGIYRSVSVRGPAGTVMVNLYPWSAFFFLWAVITAFFGFLVFLAFRSQTAISRSRQPPSSLAPR